MKTQLFLIHFLILISFPGFALHTDFLSDSLKYAENILSKIDNSKNLQKDSVIRLVNRGLKLVGKNDTSILAGEFWLRRGVAYYYKGNFEQAAEDELKALKLFENLNYHKGAAAVYNDLGTLMRKMDDTTSAKAYYLQALKLSIEVSDSAQIANSYNNLGIYSAQRGDYKKAIDFYTRSSTIKSTLNDFYGLTFDLNNLAEAYANLSNYDKSIQYLDSALKLKITMKDRIGTAITINNIGETYLNSENYEMALIYFQSALDSSKVVQYKDLEQHALGMISLVLERQEKPIDALRYFKVFNSLKDSLFNIRKREQVLELSTKYEAQKKEQEIASLEAESRISALEIKQQRVIIISILAGASMFILGLILVFSRRRYKLRALLLEEKSNTQKTRFRSVIEGEEIERKRIAQELHDGLGQILSTARIIVSSSNIESEKLDKSIALIDTAVDEVRSISHNLMPNALIAYGVRSAIDDLFRTVADSSKIKIDLTITDELRLEEHSSIGLFRVLQECLNNTLKYAKATHIILSIVLENQIYKVEYSDDGNGFDVESNQKTEGIGLENMQSRIELIGGKFKIVSNLGKGTSIIFSIPCYDE